MSEFQKNIPLKCDVWCIDGTLKSVSNHFYQPITIHDKFIGTMHPLCFVLLYKKI